VLSHLVMPNVECLESNDDYVRLAIEPLETGFGVTWRHAGQCFEACATQLPSRSSSDLGKDRGDTA